MYAETPVLALICHISVCILTLIYFVNWLMGTQFSRTPSQLQPQIGQISIEPHPKKHFEK